MSSQNRRDQERESLFSLQTRGLVEPKCKLQPVYFTLSNGVLMPSMGVSLHEMKFDFLIKDVVDDALKAGYRLFNTSTKYNNEYHLQNALEVLLPKYNLKRSNIFIVSKFNKKSVHTSQLLSAPESHYIDLILLENPGKWKMASNRVLRELFLISSWKELVDMYRAGRVRALGLYNFNTMLIKLLMKCNFGIKPMVNQMSWYPYQMGNLFSRYCQKHNIIIQSLDTYGSPINYIIIKYNPNIATIAKSLNVKTTDLVIAWSLQRGVPVIPRSVCYDNTYIDIIPEHFDIPEYFMSKLDVLIGETTKDWREN